MSREHIKSPQPLSANSFEVLLNENRPKKTFLDGHYLIQKTFRDIDRSVHFWDRENHPSSDSLSECDTVELPTRGGHRIGGTRRGLGFSDTTVQFPRNVDGHCVEAHSKCWTTPPIEFSRGTRSFRRKFDLVRSSK